MILCDKCGAGFIPAIIRERQGKTESTFFTCPVCGERYEILKTDEHDRRLIGQRKAIQKRIKALSDVEKIRQAMQRDGVLKKRIGE